MAVRTVLRRHYKTIKQLIKEKNQEVYDSMFK